MGEWPPRAVASPPCAPRWPSRSASPAPRPASRAWPARAAAPPCPESCSGSWIQARSTGSRLASRRARRSSPRPTARRPRRRWWRASSSRRRSSPTTAPARTSSPAWPRRSWPPGTPSWACSRSTRRRCRRSRGGSRRERSRSATSSATSSTATASSSWWRSAGARWRAAFRRGRAGRQRRRPAARRDRLRPARLGRLRPGRPASRLPRAPARGRLEVVRPLRDAVRVRGGLHRPSRRLPLPRVRPCAAAAGRPRPRDRAGRARERLVRARHAGRLRPRRAAGAGPLQRLQRAGGRLARPRARRLARGHNGGLAGLFRRLRPFRAHPARRPLAARAADQEPRRRERGRAHARRRRAPRLLLVALNDEIADGRDVSWIWDVDFEPLLGAWSGWSRPASARPSSRCASSTPGCRRRRSRSCPRSRRRSTAASS